MQITWFGNATVKVNSDSGASIVIDPFFSRNPAISQFSISDIEDVAAILVTHGHFDHVADLQSISAQLKKEIHAPEKVARNLSSRLSVPVELLHYADYEKATNLQNFSIKAFKAEHVKFDLPLIGSTLLNLLRNLNRENLTMLKRNLADHFRMPMGQCVGWFIEVDGKSMLHFGSLAFDALTTYPESVDVLSLPFQGNSEVDILALAAVDKMKPRAVLLHHFDNAFPPISSAVATDIFVGLMKQKHSDIPVYIPEYRIPITL